MSKVQVISVLEHGGIAWNLGAFVPGSTDTTIMKMFQLDGGLVEVYAAPKLGTDYDKAKMGLIFTISTMSIKLVVAVAPFDIWKQLMAETEASLDEEEEEEEEEEKLELPPGYTLQPTPQQFQSPPTASSPIPTYIPPTPPQNPNGSGTPS